MVYCHGEVVSLLLARGAGIEQLQKEAVLEHRAIVAEASQAEAELAARIGKATAAYHDLVAGQGQIWGLVASSNIHPPLLLLRLRF